MIQILLIAAAMLLAPTSIRASAGTVMRAFVPAIALLAPLFIAAGALAQEVKLTRPARSGVESLLANERSWDGKCMPLPTSVTITTPPSNGKATIIQGVSTIPATTPRFGGTGHCAGKSIIGNQIMYRSDPGFRGTDTLGYKVTHGDGKSGSTIISIDVH